MKDYHKRYMMMTHTLDRAKRAYLFWRDNKEVEGKKPNIWVFTATDVDNALASSRYSYADFVNDIGREQEILYVQDFEKKRKANIVDMMMHMDEFEYRGFNKFEAVYLCVDDEDNGYYALRLYK